MDNQKPLAEHLRPKTIHDIVGQDHLLGDDCQLVALYPKTNYPP